MKEWLCTERDIGAWGKKENKSFIHCDHCEKRVEGSVSHCSVPQRERERERERESGEEGCNKG